QHSIRFLVLPEVFPLGVEAQSSSQRELRGRKRNAIVHQVLCHFLERGIGICVAAEEVGTLWLEWSLAPEAIADVRHVQKRARSVRFQSRTVEILHPSRSNDLQEVVEMIRVAPAFEFLDDVAIAIISNGAVVAGADEKTVLAFDDILHTLGVIRFGGKAPDFD